MRLRTCLPAPRHRAVWAGTLVALALLVSASADPRSDLRQRQVELEELKARIEERQRKIAKLRSEGESLEKILAELERQRSVTSQYVATLDAQVAALEGDLDARRGHLRTKEVELTAARAGLGRSMVRYYKRGRLESAELLLSSQSLGEIFARSHTWVRAIYKLREQIDGVSHQSATIESELSETELRRQMVLVLRSERAQKLAELETQGRERQRDRAELERTIERQEAQTARLIASQQEIERMIAAAQRRPSSAGGAGLTDRQGQLPWPVTGDVVASFGTQVHPRYGTSVRQKGIQIAAPEGTPVRAVAGGQVTYVGWLAGYGNTVVLDHGQGFFTLYAHAAEILVGNDQRVDEGQTIARVGSTDSLFGAGLHFEIRAGKEAQDPGRWLARK